MHENDYKMREIEYFEDQPEKVDVPMIVFGCLVAFAIPFAFAWISAGMVIDLTH